VRDFFEENGTAYLVMDYYEGKTLKAFLQEQPEGRMDPEIGTEIMLRVLDGLKEVHAEGYLHRDIKPSNIYLTQEGRPILIDFGAARLALGEKSRSLSVVMTEGYAPYEQYRREGDQGSWTDVYGAGATLYRMVTGEKPPPATDRVVDDTLRPAHEVSSEVPKGLSRAITDALATGNKERPQSAEALQDRLREGLRGGATEQEKKEPRQEQEPSRGSADASEAFTEPSASGADNGRGAETSVEDNGVPWPSVLIGVLVVAALGLGGVAVALYPSASSGDRSKTDQFLKEARVHLEAGRLTSPEGTNALASVRQALDQNPGSAEAQELRGQIADRLAEKGTAAQEEGNLRAAVDFYGQSLKLEGDPTLREELKSTQRVRKVLKRSNSIIKKDYYSAKELKSTISLLQGVLAIERGKKRGKKIIIKAAKSLKNKNLPVLSKNFVKVEALGMEKYKVDGESVDGKELVKKIENKIYKRKERNGLSKMKNKYVHIESKSEKYHKNALEKVFDAHVNIWNDIFEKDLLPYDEYGKIEGLDKRYENYEQYWNQLGVDESNNISKKFSANIQIEVKDKKEENMSKPDSPPVPIVVPKDKVIEEGPYKFRIKVGGSGGDGFEGEGQKEKIFQFVENQPELIGGMKALQESVEYPEFAKKAGIEGRVIVQFVVDEQGNVQDPKVTRGVHKLLNEEAIRAVKKQKFKPGKQRGEAVKVQMSLPVTFR
jgi:TonB family protein